METAIDRRAFREAMGCFATGVTIVTAMGAGGHHIVFVGEVKHMRIDATGRPLLYFRGDYRVVDGDA